MMLRRLGGKRLLNQLLNDKAFYWTAPATPAPATQSMLKTVLTPPFFPCQQPQWCKRLNYESSSAIFVLLPNFMLSNMLRIRSALETTGSFQYYASLLQMIQQNLRKSQKTIWKKFHSIFFFYLRTENIYFLLKYPSVFYGSGSFQIIWKVCKQSRNFEKSLKRLFEKIPKKLYNLDFLTFY